jgi:hypothetical protein
MDGKLPNQISLSFNRGTLLLTGVDRGQLPAEPGSPIWTWDARVGAWRCDAIHYAAVRAILSRRFTSRFHDDVLRPDPVCWPKMDLPTLRPEQQEAVAA